MVALVLLTAGALKLHGLLTSANGTPNQFPQWLQWLSITWEFALASWLISGKGIHAARIATITTFAIFAFVSLWQGWSGERTCCCLGRVPVGPWLVFGLDLTVCSALEALDWPTETINLSPGSRVEWRFRLHNTANDAITIRGFSSSCQCFTIVLDREIILAGTTVSGTAILDLSREPEFSGNLGLTVSIYLKSQSARQILPSTNAFVVDPRKKGRTENVGQN
jgi:hypothetical protein